MYQMGARCFSYSPIAGAVGEASTTSVTFRSASYGGTVGLRGTGIAVVNPPWQFDDQMREVGTWLTRKLEAGKHSVKWLKREET